MNFNKKNNRWRQTRQTRLAIVQSLYQMYFSKITLDEVSIQFLNKGRVEINFNEDVLDKKEQILFTKLDFFLFKSILNKILIMHNDIEHLIVSYLYQHCFFRKLDLLIQIILLVGVSELLIGSAPPIVVISEYVIISHGFFLGNREAFLINGLLDGISKKIIVHAGN